MVDTDKIRISSEHLIPLSFFILIIIGTLLLLLPVASASGEKTEIITALFTATSSVCVTGLIVTDTYSHWSLFGQIVIMFLIQVGGLGVVTVGAYVRRVGRRKFSMSDRILLSDSLNIEKKKGLLTFLNRIMKGTIIVEGMGIILYAVKFIPMFGLPKGIWVSAFQAVSAFCNAGMDVAGPDSMIGFRDSSLLMCVTMILIILGGLGFIVWFDIIDGVKQGIKNRLSFSSIVSHLSEHSKVVIIMTLLLIISGTMAVMVTEYNNPDTIGNMKISGKLMNSLFQSVTLRTAGFASIPQEKLSELTSVIGCVLMFIGGSPSGCAGGVKNVTLFFVFMNALSYIRGKKENVVFHKRVSEELMRKASAIVIVSFTVLLFMTLLLMSRGGISFVDALYEITSALGTVGLSRNLTPGLDNIGKIIVIVSMYLGRIGPISMALFFLKPADKEYIIKHSDGVFYV